MGMRNLRTGSTMMALMKVAPCPTIKLPMKLTKQPPSSLIRSHPLCHTKPNPACFKASKFAAGNMNCRLGSSFWHHNNGKDAIYVKFRCVAKTKDGKDDQDPPSESGSNESSKPSRLKCLQEVKDWIRQLPKMLNDNKIKIALWKFSSEAVPVLAKHPSVKILYLLLKNFAPPLHVIMTQSKLTIKPKIKLADVEGVDAAKTELHEGLLILQKDDKYMKHGVQLSKGYLLVGDPGTGKTLLAEAVAGEAAAGVSFFSVFASEYAGVGAGATGIEDLFREAREKEPSIVFIDQIEAIGKPCGTTSTDQLHPASIA